LKVVLKQASPETALRIRTMGLVEDQYAGGQFEKVW
jgi:hypothetical protein